MKVKTLSESQLKSDVATLMEAVEKDFSPHALVSIARGGDFLAQHIPISKKFSIRIQRPSTEKRGNIVKKFIRIMPYAITDTLRIAEAYWLKLKTGGEQSSEIQKKLILPPALTEFISSGANKILIIDDAVDSGHTIEAAVKAINALSKDLEIRTASLVLTRKDACVKPDYFLYSPGTLLRFPWSDDYREKNN